MSVRFRRDSREIDRFLRSAGVAADIERRRAAVQAAAGTGFGGSTRDGRTRVVGTVVATTGDALRRQAADHVLERAIWAGR